MPEPNPVTFVLVVRRDGTALQLEGEEACHPWEQLSLEQSSLWMTRGWVSQTVKWADGRTSYEAIQQARAARRPA